MRVLIVDDEQPARMELIRLLGGMGEIDVVGEATDAASAIEKASQLKPDVVFLDIELPDGSGLEVAERLPKPGPAVIFVTAYEEYSLQALRLRATDYLLKPIDPEMLLAAVQRVQPGTPLDGGARAMRHLGSDDRVFLRDGGKSWFSKVSNVRLLESDGNYTRLYIGKDKPMVHRALREFEAKLDPSLFFRVNRHQIVNLDHVESVEFNSKDDMSLTLNCGLRIEMSRRMGRIFRERMAV
jgi:two-component system, LytTR family, response regulator